MSIIINHCYVANREGELPFAVNPITNELHISLVGYAVVPLEDYDRCRESAQAYARQVFGARPAHQRPPEPSTYAVEDI